MADLSDVNNALVALASSAVYPAGEGAASAVVTPVKIYAGWPDPKTLDADLGLEPALAEPSCYHVSVFNLPAETDTTRYPSEWSETQPDASSYAMAVVGQVVTVTGAAPNPLRQHNFAIGIGPKPYVLAVTTSRTPTQIAAALAALIAVDIIGTTSSGADITIPAPYRIGFARVGGVGSALKEVGRQQKSFQVSIWAAKDAQRTALAKLIEPVFGDTARLVMPDGSYAHLVRRSGTNYDRAQRQGAYRRDLVYSVEYATTVEVAAAQIVALPVELDDPTGAEIVTILE